jgi:hypothetical protein
VESTDGWSIERQEPATLEDAVDDRWAKSSSWSMRPHAFGDLSQQLHFVWQLSVCEPAMIFFTAAASARRPIGTLRRKAIRLSGKCTVHRDTESYATPELGVPANGHAAHGDRIACEHLA